MLAIILHAVCVLGHVQMLEHVPVQMLEHVPVEILEHVPMQILEHVPEQILEHLLVIVPTHMCQFWLLALTASICNDSPRIFTKKRCIAQQNEHL